MRCMAATIVTAADPWLACNFRRLDSDPVSFYTSLVQQKYAKRAAWLLLILMVLDLSTASVCTAGTFPGFAAGGASGVSAGVLAHAEGPLNTDDDGCFCC